MSELGVPVRNLLVGIFTEGGKNMNRRTFFNSSTSSALRISKSRLSMTASLAIRLMRSSSRVFRAPDKRFQPGSVLVDFLVENRDAEADPGDMGSVCDREGDAIV